MFDYSNPLQHNLADLSYYIYAWSSSRGWQRLTMYISSNLIPCVWEGLRDINMAHTNKEVLQATFPQYTFAVLQSNWIIMELSPPST